jgi:DNA/RNA endonuclease G (NUC1)
MSRITPRMRVAVITAFITVLALIGTYVVIAAISLSTSTAYTQNLDGIGTSATATMPTDFKVDRTTTATAADARKVGTFAAAGTTTTQVGGANVSTSAANGIYNFGSGTTTTGPDRSVGWISAGTGTASGNLYAQLVNSTPGNLAGLQIAYNVEKYRNGSNANGFRIQMFYSTDGTNWTNAGNSFLTSFPADANNNGFATAPGATVAVNQTLNVTIPSGGSFYLAWNYSVSAGTTFTNAQGLAVDDVSILGIAGAGPTNPTGTGTATPNLVDQGGTTLLTVAVSPGHNPDSTAHTVTANLSSIGGSSSQTFFDDGTHGDVSQNDNTFSFTATVSNGTAAGGKSLPVTIQETAPSNRTGNASISLTVNTPTSPTGVGAATPSTVQAGNNSLLTVSVSPGTHPTSTGLAVSANLTPIGGSGTQQFFDNGTNGDVTAGDNVFSFDAAVAAATTAGTKTIAATIADAQSRTGSANISLTVTSATTSPTGTGSATPASTQIGGTTLLAVNVTPGAGPASTGIAVSGNLSSIGGSASQQFYDDGSNGDVTPGDNVFSYGATVAVTTTPGAKTVPFTVNDAQARSSSGNIGLTVTPQIVPPGTIVLSQVYGGGGNSGATLTNDFIELFNRSQNAVSLAGWSVQYASAGGGAGATWNRRTPLSGVINPGQYFLISEAAGTGGSTPLPTADVIGSIAMGATDGKVALVSNNTDLPAGCPIGNSNLIDFIGYGSADCFEGSAAAQVLTNTTAHFRKRSGCQDFDNNSTDFTRSAPSPRNSSTTGSVCPASGDFAPGVESTSPANGAPGIDNNSNITVTFDEPVTVTAGWATISCSVSSIHTYVTTGGPSTFTINPDVDFGSAEQCTVTINHTQVFDQDSVDPPDNPDADYIFTFNTSVVRDPAEHMVMGNPSGAITDEGTPLNYLMMKPQYALSYNNDKGTPNWTSWHLDNTWTTGVADRQDDFRSDDTLPAGFKHVSNGYNFATYMFDRGHMCPSADRTSSISDNSATFLMTNMVPQASGNNQGPWASMENYIRAQLAGATNEIYIVSGPTGVGGNSTTGHWNSIVDTGGNSVTVPAFTWKVVMVLPNAAGDDVARVSSSTRTFAVIMPNNDNIRPDQWQKYLATVRQVETLSGYNFFSNVPQSVQDVIETQLDVVNDTAPVATGASATTAEDIAKVITLSATDFNVNNQLVFSSGVAPLHGNLGAFSSAACNNGTCTATVTYTPAADYNGPDSFTFSVNDGALNSNAANVSLSVTEVNDDPSAVNDAKTATEDSTLSFPATDLTANDSAGPNESGQTLTVDAVISTPNTHGTVVLNAGQVQYSPDGNFNGTASFDYHVCDNGTTNGAPDPKCATGTVNITVDPANDNPVANDDSATTDEDTPANINILGNDSDVDGDSVTVSAVTQGAHGSVTNNGNNVSYSPALNFNGSDSFSYTVSDGHGGTATANVNVTINAVNDAPVATDDSATTDEDTPATISVLGNDADVDGDSLTITGVSQGAHGSVANNGNNVSYSPAANFNGSDSFTYTIGDGHGGTATANVSVTINAVNDAPVAADDSATTNEDTPIAISVLANDSDVDGDSLTVSAVTQGAHGSVTNNGNDVSYSPAANFNGSDSFTYTMSDGHGGTATANVSVTINAVNDAPVANDDSATTDEDTSVNINVLTNDADVDGDSMTVSAVTQGAHGSVSNNGSNVTYAPVADYHGSDSFSYTISDGHGGTATANVSVIVNAVNDNPIAIADSAATNEDNSVTIDVVANDTDVDGDTLSLNTVGSPSHGSVSIVSGKAVYSPAANYNGSDSFGYVVSDGHGGQANGSVSVTVTPVNDAPTANNQSVATSSNTPVSITLTGNDLETPSGSLTFTVTSGPSHGSLSGSGANRTYSPGLNYAGPDSFKFTVTDAGDNGAPPLTSSEATVSITVGDTVGPVITLNGNSIALWPPNKKFHPITVADLVAGASDNFDPNVNLNSVVIASVSSDEGTAANGDIVVAADCKSVHLRADRNGNGDGRVYTITFRARDAAGNTSFVSAKVTVPHDQGNGGAIDSGAAYTINSSCP